MIAYLSGCYSAETKEKKLENISAHRKVAIELWNGGVVCCSPVLNTSLFEDEETCNCSYDDYIKGDLELLARCDVIVMLQGWNNSKGATKERDFAKFLGMPIYYYPETPVQREEMTEAQEYHLAKVIYQAVRDISHKYADGQRRHGGNLFDKPNLPMLLEEVQDMVVYAYTLQDQIKTACGLMFEDTEALNILTRGNKNGVILNDKEKEV